MLGVDERRYPALLLSLGDDFECQSRFAGRFGTVDFTIRPRGKPPQPNAISSDREPVGMTSSRALRTSPVTSSPFTKLLFDLRKRRAQRFPLFSSISLILTVL